MPPLLKDFHTNLVSRRYLWYLYVTCMKVLKQRRHINLTFLHVRKFSYISQNIQIQIGGKTLPPYDPNGQINQCTLVRMKQEYNGICTILVFHHSIVNQEQRIVFNLIGLTQSFLPQYPLWKWLGGRGRPMRNATYPLPTTSLITARCPSHCVSPLDSQPRTTHSIQSYRTNAILLTPVPIVFLFHTYKYRLETRLVLAHRIFRFR
jgi:hypothetical protein